MEIEFIPIDYDYFDFQERNYIRIIGRDSKGKRVCVFDSCPVYFWAILEEGLSEKKIKHIVEEIQKIQLDIKKRNTKVEKVEVHDKKFLGKDVKALKIFATNYKDLQDVAEKLDMEGIVKRRGYDLGFITHYIIEKKILPLNWYKISGDLLGDDGFGGNYSSLDVDFCMTLDKCKKLPPKEFKPKILSYDIETEEFQIGEGEILMISLVSDNFKKVLTWKTGSKHKPSYVEYVKNEEELLEKFSEYVNKIAPDFLVGYFSDGFDLPYLKARSEKLKIPLKLGIDGSQPRFHGGAFPSGKISGIVHIDLLRFIKTAYAQYMQSESLTLNEVAKEFIGDQKKEFEFKHSSKIKGDEWNDYFEYNLHDSELVKDLFEKFWPDMFEFTQVLNEPLFEVTRAGLSKYTECYVLHNLDKFNEIPEKKPTNEEMGVRNRISVEGAFVFEPTPGIYEDIAMFDFTSMHTSIIITHNLSKSTLIQDEKQAKKQKDVWESPEINEAGEKVHYYFTKKSGFFPELMKEIFELRKKAKQEYQKDPNPITKARSNAFKVLSASAHGYVAFFGARYYSHEASASILAFVRKYNKETIEKVEKAGYKVIFGDTDSVAFLMKDKTKTDVKKLLEKLNSELPGVMRMELEDFYKRGLWVTKRGGDIGAKKKYALITEDGKLKIRGFETVRRDWCGLARKVQNDVLRIILDEGNEKKAVDYVKKIIDKLKKREIKKEELVIRTQLKKSLLEYKAISPHVIAAQKMKEKDIPITQGNLVSYYIAESQEKKKLVRDRVKLPDEPGEYDINYYLEHQLIPAVENILNVFKIDIKEIIEGKRQTTLFDFK